MIFSPATVMTLLPDSPVFQRRSYWQEWSCQPARSAVFLYQSPATPAASPRRSVPALTIMLTVMQQSGRVPLQLYRGQRQPEGEPSDSQYSRLNSSSGCRNPRCRFICLQLPSLSGPRLLLAGKQISGGIGRRNPGCLQCQLHQSLCFGGQRERHVRRREHDAA